MIWPLLQGLGLTLRRLFSKKITIQYPDKKYKVPARWRGVHYFRKNEAGETTCVACGLCVAACPNACITLEIGERADGSRYPLKYEIDPWRCIFCGFCQDACPVSAINLGENYEQAYYHKEDFVLDTKKLLSMYEGKK
jgi:NADH-quinone oxidoreductase subunit I